MDYISVSCNQCGESLEVSANSRFVTCSSCRSQLEIHRTETAWFTEAIDRGTHGPSTDRVNRDVERLDREWQSKCEDEFADVEKSNGAIHWFLVLVWVLLFGVIARIHFAASVFWILFGVFVFLQAIGNQSKRIRFRNEQHKYSTKRSQLLSERRPA
ncbi:MAG: hypothetical protein KDB27_31945 [Planctomycetales bacterium]|nr:hypothetical protein [Planctomycetales bacterium]